MGLWQRILAWFRRNPHGDGRGSDIFSRQEYLPSMSRTERAMRMHHPGGGMGAGTP